MVCIFFDLSKAFDLLPLYLIMDSLARVGICWASVIGLVTMYQDVAIVRPVMVLPPHLLRSLT